MRRLFGIIRKLVEERAEAWDTPDLPWQSVSAFCFLRFLVPAILHPHLFKLCPGSALPLTLICSLIHIVEGHPPPPVSRSLTLIAKVIMSMASLNTVNVSLKITRNHDSSNSLTRVRVPKRS
jgi:hypothetical protein